MARDGSAWKIVGIGCLVVAVVGVGVTIGAGVFLYRQAKKIEAEMKDPDARTARARRILGTSTIPDGYHAMLALSVPLLGDLAILSSRAPNAQGEIHELGERGLIYLQFIRSGEVESELRDYCEGKTTDPAVLRRNKIKVDPAEVIGRGVVPLRGGTLLYVAQRGSVATHGFHGEGVTAITMIDCPGDERLRAAIWFGPDGPAAPDGGPPDLTGTPADERALAEFLGQFEFCR